MDKFTTEYKGRKTDKYSGVGFNHGGTTFMVDGLEDGRVMITEINFKMILIGEDIDEVHDEIIKRWDSNLDNNLDTLSK